MADTVIAVRMPRSLIAELRERTEHDHYSDLSEQVRSIVRRGCLKYTNPVTHEIKELKEQLKTELLKEQQQATAKQSSKKSKNFLKPENNKEVSRDETLHHHAHHPLHTLPPRSGPHPQPRRPRLPRPDTVSSSQNMSFEYYPSLEGYKAAHSAWTTKALPKRRLPTTPSTLSPSSTSTPETTSGASPARTAPRPSTRSSAHSSSTGNHQSSASSRHKTTR